MPNFRGAGNLFQQSFFSLLADNQRKEQEQRIAERERKELEEIQQFNAEQNRLNRVSREDISAADVTSRENIAMGRLTAASEKASSESQSREIRLQNLAPRMEAVGITVPQISRELLTDNMINDFEDRVKALESDRLIRGRQRPLAPETPVSLNSTQLNEIDEILAKKYVKWIPGGIPFDAQETGNISNIYWQLPTVKQKEWDEDKAELINQATIGGTAGLYQSPAPEASAIPEGAVLAGRSKTTGRNIYRLPDGRLWEE